MRSLVQPNVIRSAGIATFFTALACWPRLSSWPNRAYQFWFVLLTLSWAAFILWSFVFAWHSKFTGQQVFRFTRQPVLWIIATLSGLGGASILHLMIDPVLRSVAPQEYPRTISSWTAMTLFLLAFDQLFLCFAPFAFFVRLIRSEKAAITLTVLFGAFLVYLKIQVWSAEFPLVFVLELYAWRILASGLSVYFYLRGGVPLAWWWVFLLQLRHLINLPG